MKTRDAAMRSHAVRPRDDGRCRTADQSITAEVPGIRMKRSVMKMKDQSHVACVPIRIVVREGGERPRVGVHDRIGHDVTDHSDRSAEQRRWKRDWCCEV